MARTQKMSQSEILRRLGVPQSEWRFLNGNGLAQRAANQAAARRGLPQPFNPSFADALVQDLIPLGVVAGAAAAGTAGAIASTGAAGGAAVVAPAASSVISSVGGAINSVGDFLSYIAWIFHPLNFLRVAEFSTGLGLFFFGLHIVLKQAFRSGRTHRGGISGMIGSMFPAYRARRMGRRKGRLDRSYQQARREARAV